MKFTVNREKLQKALQRVGSIIGSRSMLPVLGNVMIQAEEGVLTLTTTDLEIRISTKVDAVVEEAGVTTARLAGRLLRRHRRRVRGRRQGSHQNQVRHQPFHFARTARRRFPGRGRI